MYSAHLNKTVKNEANDQLKLSKTKNAPINGAFKTDFEFFYWIASGVSSDFTAV